MKSELEFINGPCACMGPQGDDPVCPCAMRNKGLQPTDSWTPEQVEKLREAMGRLTNST